MGFSISDDDIKHIDLPFSGYFRRRVAHSIMTKDLIKSNREGYDLTFGFTLFFKMYNSLGYFVSTNQEDTRAIGKLFEQERVISPVGSIFNSTKRSIDLYQYVSNGKQMAAKRMFEGKDYAPRYFSIVADKENTLWDYEKISTLMDSDILAKKINDFYKNNTADERIKKVGKLLKPYGVNQKSVNGISIKTDKGNKGIMVEGAIKMLIELKIINDLFL
jgi:hypothetical protein